MPVPRSIPDHIPLKYTGLDYCCVAFRHVYFTLEGPCTHKIQFQSSMAQSYQAMKPLRVVMLPMWCRAPPHTPVVKCTHLHPISSGFSVNWLLPVAIPLMTTVASIIIFTYIWRTWGNSVAISKWFFLQSIGDISPTQIYKLRTPSLMSGRNTCITNLNIHITSTRMSHWFNHIKLQHWIDAFQTWGCNFSLLLQYSIVARAERLNYEFTQCGIKLQHWINAYQTEVCQFSLLFEGL